MYSMRLNVIGFLALQDPLYRQPHFHENMYLKKRRTDKINSLIAHKDPPVHEGLPSPDYEKELPFYDVLPDEKAPAAPTQSHDGVTKPSSIARLLGVNVVERDPPYGYRADTSRNFIRIHILRQYRMKQSKLMRGRPKVKLPLANMVPFTGCFIHVGALPPELWLQVLESLHPIDLYHLSRVNKASSEFLSSPSFDHIWRETFIKHKIPLQPVGWRLVSHVEWASLLFGPSACSTCGRRGAVIDFAYTRRVCRKCWVEVYIHENGHPTHPPTDIIWSLLPQTRRRMGGNLSVFWSDMKYYRPAFERIATKLSELHAQKERKEISEQEFAKTLGEFKAKCPPTKLGTYEEWIEALHEAEADHLNHHPTRQWVLMLKEELKKMGYRGPNNAGTLMWRIGPDDRSCKGVIYMFPRRLINKLQHFLPQWLSADPNGMDSPHGLTKLKDRYEAQINKAGKAYEKFRDRHYTNCSGVEFLPTLTQLLTMADAPFYLSIKTAMQARKKTGAYRDEDISTYVQRFQEGIKGKFLAMLPFSVHASPSSDPAPPIALDVMNSADRLELATSIFACANCVDCQIYQDWLVTSHEKGRDNEYDGEAHSEVSDGYINNTEAQQVPWQAGRLLVGWRNINGHFGCPRLDGEWDEERQIVYSKDGADAARSLVPLVGLDPEVSKAEDMDRLDKRFTCTNCPIASTGKRGRRGRYVLTWKDCVLHYIEMRRLKDPQHLSPQWRKLAGPMEKWIKTREEHHDETKDPSWQCLHCFNYNDKMVSETHIISHIQMMHNKSSPVVGEDYKYSFRGPTNRCKPVGMAEHPSVAQWYCGICQDLHPQPDRQLKLSSLRSILQHMKDKHETSAPEEGKEHRCYQAYDD